MKKRIPTTVVTGSLGAGKTTLLLNIIKQLPKEYKSLWLKNEYGDVNIDSEIAKAANIETKEILNGCICCVLIGKLHNALVDIVKKYNIDRLFIETAGTAYPYPIIQEISSIPELRLDGLIVVIDALNFEKFSDKSHLARSQAEFVDLVVINKAELVSIEDLERIEDELFDLYPAIPKIYSKEGYVLLDSVMGLDEMQLNRSVTANHKKKITHEHRTHEDVEVFTLENEKMYEIDSVVAFLKQLNSADFYRIKGVIITDTHPIIVNYVLGRITIDTLKNYKGNTKITFMGRSISPLKNTVLKRFTEIGK